MDCQTCERTDSRRQFYCPNCISIRLAEHHQQRQRLRAALDLANAKAAAILVPRPESNLFGAQEERELKADKFSLAVRVREMRLGAEEAKEFIARERLVISQRRQKVARRRTNLESGQSLLATRSHSATIDAQSFASTSPSPPDSLRALDNTRQAVSAKQLEISETMESTRNILVREMLAVYGFSRSTPSNSTQHSITSSVKSTHSTTSSSSSTISIPRPHATHQLAQLPIPSLSEIHTFAPTVLAASLSHLLHLVRLLALYLEIKLPFTPLPSLFGPGRPGLRAAVGWGDSKLPSTYPLFPATTTSKSKSKLTHFPAVLGSTNGEQSGGREELSLVKEKERVDERLKLVVGGAVALAFDLAFIVWIRGGSVALEEVDDLGVLLAKAVGIGTSTSSASPRSTTAAFPLDFSALLAMYTSPSSRSTKESMDKFLSGDEEGWDIV